MKNIQSIKKHVLPLRKVDTSTFNYIKKGIKKVETRGGGPKYASIQDGDILVFKCGKQKFEMKIRKVRKFRSLKGLFKKYKIKDVMPEISTLKEAEAIYHKYPGYKERLKKFGILAFEL